MNLRNLIAKFPQATAPTAAKHEAHIRPEQVRYEGGILKVTFGQTVYSFEGVTEEKHREFMSAPSMGKWFHANIRGKYPFTKKPLEGG
jgi:hypothetical protein